MPQLVPPFAHLGGIIQDAVHGARGAEVHLFFKQGGVDLGWGLVDETLRVKRVEDRMRNAYW